VLAGELVDVARKWNTPTEVGAALRVLAHADPAGRLDLLTESVAVLENSPARLELARALVDLGEALRVAGRRSEARDPLHRGIELATECGSIALRTRAVAALAASCAAAGRRLGLPMEDRAFRAHLTLGRVKGRAPMDLRPLVNELHDYEGPSWSASALLLMRSYLGAEARHETLASWPLRDAEPPRGRRNEPPVRS
jgi:hypothetical protein